MDAADDDAISLLFTCGSTQTTFPIDGASASSAIATFSNASGYFLMTTTQRLGPQSLAP